MKILLLLALFSPLAHADMAVLITHASSDWDHLEGSKWASVSVLQTFQQHLPEVPIYALQKDRHFFSNFLSLYLAPSSIFLSQSGELTPTLDANRVFLLGGNFSDCQRQTVTDLLRSSVNRELIFITPAIYDYVTGVASGLEYPASVQQAARSERELRRARSGVGSPTFTLDWILDRFESDEARERFLCQRTLRAYQLSEDVAVDLRLRNAWIRCAEGRGGKARVRVRFLHPGATDISLQALVRATWAE